MSKAQDQPTITCRMSKDQACIKSDIEAILEGQKAIQESIETVKTDLHKELAEIKGMLANTMEINRLRHDMDNMRMRQQHQELDTLRDAALRTREEVERLKRQRTDL